MEEDFFNPEADGKLEHRAFEAEACVEKFIAVVRQLDLNTEEVLEETPDIIAPVVDVEEPPVTFEPQPEEEVNIPEALETMINNYDTQPTFMSPEEFLFSKIAELAAIVSQGGNTSERRERDQRALRNTNSADDLTNQREERLENTPSSTEHSETPVESTASSMQLNNASNSPPVNVTNSGNQRNVQRVQELAQSVIPPSEPRPIDVFSRISLLSAILSQEDDPSEPFVANQLLSTILKFQEVEKLANDKKIISKVLEIDRKASKLKKQSTSTIEEDINSNPQVSNSTDSIETQEPTNDQLNASVSVPSLNDFFDETTGSATTLSESHENSEDESEPVDQPVSGSTNLPETLDPPNNGQRSNRNIPAGLSVKEMADRIAEVIESYSKELEARKSIPGPVYEVVWKKKRVTEIPELPEGYVGLIIPSQQTDPIGDPFIAELTDDQAPQHRVVYQMIPRERCSGKIPRLTETTGLTDLTLPDPETALISSNTITRHESKFSSPKPAPATYYQLVSRSRNVWQPVQLNAGFHPYIEPSLDDLNAFWDRQVKFVPIKITDPADPTYKIPAPFHEPPLGLFQKVQVSEESQILSKEKQEEDESTNKTQPSVFSREPKRWTNEHTGSGVMDWLEKRRKREIEAQKKRVYRFTADSSGSEAENEDEQAANATAIVPVTDPDADDQAVIAAELRRKYGGLTRERILILRQKLGEGILNHLVDEYKFIYDKLQIIYEKRIAGDYMPDEPSLSQRQIRTIEKVNYKRARQWIDDEAALLWLKETLFYPSAMYRLPELAIREIIYECFKENLSERVYSNNSTQMAALTGLIANKITLGIRALECPRYKILTYVTLGENQNQELETITRCNWNDFCDRLIFETYAFRTYFCNIAVYGIYFN